LSRFLFAAMTAVAAGVAFAFLLLPRSAIWSTSSATTSSATRS
jgi:hypothetical protein